MAQDCYALFKSVYNQGIADKLPAVAAQVAAQSAMDNCLAQQRLQVPAVSPVVTVPADNNVDPGPTTADRGSTLGKRSKG